MARKKKKGMSWGLRLLMVMSVIMAAVFLPSSFLLFVGLLPTVVAFFVDSGKKKIKVVTVGAMNIAGCVPFLMELWTSDHTLQKSFAIILDPMAIVVIYSAALIGYILDWLVSIMVANYLYQRGQARLKAIAEEQREMIERWGQEVTGLIPMDAEGFPYE